MRPFNSVVRRAGALLIVVILACGGTMDPSSGGNPSGGGAGGGGGGGGGTPSVPPTVLVSNNSFSPDLITVPVGATVTFKWDSCSNDGYGSTTCTAHSVTFSDGTTSETVGSGTYARSFSTAGTYAYHCSVHGTYMTGTIVVR